MCKRSRWFGVSILAATMLAATGLSLATEDLGPSARLIPSSRVDPVYPPAAFAARFPGEVTLSALVRADGTVGEIKVLESTRPKLGFEQASKDAVGQWLFEPAEMDGEPVESYAVLRLSFGVDRGRYGQQGTVGGTFLNPMQAPGASASTKRAPASAENKAKDTREKMKPRTLAGAKFPPVCDRCIFDRRELAPPLPPDPPAHTMN